MDLVRLRTQEEARDTEAIRDRDTPRERAVVLVASAAGVCFRKTLRYLDQGHGSPRTRAQVDGVLAAHGREDLRRAAEPCAD